MVLSAVDIGSNASRLLIVEMFETNDGEYYNKKVNFLRVPTQLGIDVFKDGEISAERIDYLLNTLSIFKNLSNLYKSESIGIVATSALRESANGQEIIQRVKSELDLDIRLIDGRKEAEYVAKSYRMVNPQMTDDQCYVIVDVGGGSVDMAIMQGKTIVESMSFSIGTIKLRRKDYSKKEWLRFENYLQYLQSSYSNINLIASGGNARKILKLFGVHVERSLLTKKLFEAENILQTLSINEVTERYNVKRDRALVMGGAVTIFKTVSEYLKVDELIVPKIGLADGVIYDIARQEYRWV